MKPQGLTVLISVFSKDSNRRTFKRMRRLMCLAVLPCMLLLAACSVPDLNFASTPTAAPLEPTPTSAPTVTPTPILPGATETLERVLNRRSLVVGLQSDPISPFVTTNEEGGFAGLDVLIADELARRWIQRPNTLALVPRATIADLVAGRVDLLMGGMPHTRSAEAEIDFSQTYWMQEDVPIAIGVAENDSLMRDLVNATLQAMVEDGTWDSLVDVATDDPYPFAPEQWFGSVPSPEELSANSQEPVETRLNRDAQLNIAFLTQPGFINTTTGDNPSGYLPDLARELNRRLTGNADANLVPMDTVPSYSSDDIDLFIGPQTHVWSLEPQVDFSQTFYGDGLALIARPGSKVESIADLNNRPAVLVETATSRALYDEAIADFDVTPILISVSESAEAVALLEDNKVDAVLIYGYPSARLLAAHVPDAILTPGRHGPILPLGIVLPANDSPLRDAVNLALQDMLADGILAELHDRYFGGDPPYPIETWPLN